MSQNLRQFMLLTKYQKSLYPPKVFKIAPHFGKLREICRPFFDLNNEKWNPPISQQIAQKSLNSPPSTMNHTKSAQFLLNHTNPCSPTVPQPFLQQISRNLLNSLILRANAAKLTNFALIPTNLLFYFFRLS